MELVYAREMVATTQKIADPSTLKATLVAGVTADAARPIESVSATLVGIGGHAHVPAALDLEGTVYRPEATSEAIQQLNAGTAAGRTTVLPRRKKQAEGASVAVEQRPRFERVRTLGKGAMGQVELARDNDIRRTVAVKRLHTDTNAPSALLRFADEVRVVGQLEHPGIVPIYDVGCDSDGEVYLVMKHLHGETMEQVIEKLRARDPDYLQRFPAEQRAHLMLSVLDAVRYAHARGILHRDLKPANIMIGPFGEVTVMDWGIAKPIARTEHCKPIEPLVGTLVESHDQRLLETQFGSLAGTPLYMSPEQAAGRNDELDERSDVYALCVLFFEWLALEHPLKSKATITEVLAAIIAEDYDPRELTARAAAQQVPVEYIFVIMRGLERDRSRRYQDVNELEQALRDVMSGRIQVRCHVTLAKRAAHGFAHWVDRNAKLYTLLFFATVLALTIGLGFGIWSVVRVAL